MMKPTTSAIVLAACLLSTACASIPDVTVAYAPPQASTTLTVTQVIACSADGSKFTVTTTPTETTSYSADPDATLVRHFRFKNVDSTFGNTNVLFKLTDDGRLSGLNSTAEGQAQQVVTAAIALGTAVNGVVLDRALKSPGSFNITGLEPPVEKSKPQTICGKTGFVDNGKDVTVKYTLQIDGQDYQNESSSKFGLLNADAGYASVFDKFKDNSKIGRPLLKVAPAAGFPVLTPAKVESGDQDPCPAAVGDSKGVIQEDPHTLCLRPVQVKLMTIATGGEVIWSQGVIVPNGPPTLAVPVPTSEPFGKLDTTLVLGDSGAIEQIGYNKSSGAAAVLATLAAIITFGATR